MTVDLWPDVLLTYHYCHQSLVPDTLMPHQSWELSQDDSGFMAKYSIDLPLLSPKPSAWHVDATSKLRTIPGWQWIWYMSNDAMAVASISWNCPTCKHHTSFSYHTNKPEKLLLHSRSILFLYLERERGETEKREGFLGRGHVCSYPLYLLFL